MSRFEYGRQSSDFLFGQLGGWSGFLMASTAPVTFWSAETGGTQYTDLLLAGTTPVTFITPDRTGRLPMFLGPDGVATMWADGGAGVGTRVRIYSELLVKDSIVIRVDDHGLVGDWTGGVGGTGTNDTVALQALVDSSVVSTGSVLQFTAGKTYRIDSVVITKSCVLDFNGASLVVKPWNGVASSANAAICFKGSSGTGRSISTAADGATSVTLTTPAHSSDFAVGDYVLVDDDHVHTNWNATTSTGTVEVNRVTAINAGTGLLTLAMPLEWTYDTSPRVRKITTIDRPVVRGLRNAVEIDPGVIWPNDLMAAPHVIQFQYAIDPLVDGCEVSSFNVHAYNFAYCFNGQIRNSRAINAYRPTNGGHGYHTRFYASRNCEAVKCYAKAVRHTVDYVWANDCGSRSCVTVENVGTAYYAHGTRSKRTYSDGDTVLQTADTSETCGWGMGNGSVGGPDYGYRIDRPTFKGIGKVFSFTTESTDMTVTNPDVTTDAEAFVMIAGAKRLVVRGGKIKLTGTAASFATSNGVLNAYKTLSGTPVALGDITFDGVTFEGDATSLAAETAGVFTARGCKHIAPSMNYTGSACYFLYTDNPTAVVIDQCQLDGGTVRNMVNMSGGVTASRLQQFTYNQSTATTTNAVSATANRALRVVGNDFRQVAGTTGGLAIAGDVVAAKTLGAVVMGNFPTTYDNQDNQVTTAAALDSAANAINSTADKRTGKPVICTDHSGGRRIHVASGTTTTSVWINPADGTTAHTPV